MILLWGALDSLDGAQSCCRRIGGLSEEAALYFRRKGCSMLFCTERAVHISVDCYDPTWSWHLELKVCIVWYHIESGECGSSEQCVVAAAEGDDIEDQLFALEVRPSIRVNS